MNFLIRCFAFMLLLAAGCARAEALFWPQWSDLGVTPASGAAVGGTDPSVILALRLGNAPVRSLDGGRTFTPFSMMGIQPQTIIGAPANPSLFYALSAQPRVPSEAPPHLFRSDDAGATWRDVAQSGFGNDWIGNIVVSSDANVLYGTRMAPSICFTGLCDYSGVEPYRSIDGGATWQATGSGVTGYDQIVRPALSSGGRTLYVGTSQGVFRSFDSGASWQRVRSDADVREVAVDRVDPATAYVRASDDAQLWVTEDSGTTWRAAAPLDIPGTGSTHAAHLLADPVIAGRVFYVGDEGHVFESTDRARTWTRVAGASGSLYAKTIAISVQGDSRFLVTIDEASVRRLELRPESYFLGSDLWWNPAEPGRGWTITQHMNGKAFVAWYAYDTQGKQVWRVMPEGAWQDARTLVGTVYETRGPAYFQGAFDPHSVSVQAAGTATLHFGSDKSASFSYALNDGTQGTIDIVREVFGTPYLFRIGDYADLWWNPAESGWGIALSQQYSKVFAAWYVYDAAGHPQWVVMPDTTFTYDVNNGYAATFRGDIYTTSGPPSTGPFDPSRVTVTKVGSASIAFSSRTEGSIRYDAFGVSATRPLSRQPF